MPKASDVRDLQGNDTTHAAAIKILWTRFEEMWAQHEAVLKDFDDDAVHDMRVASRRLRTAMQTFRACFPRKSYRVHYDRIKFLADLLGEVRDRDVLIGELQGDKHRLQLEERAGIASLIAGIRQERNEHRQSLKVFLGDLKTTAYDREFLSYLAWNM